MTSGHLRIVVCAAGPARDVSRLIEVAHERWWTVDVVATDSARAFLDIPSIERLCGAPVRSSHRMPSDVGRVARAVDALVVAPATYNTVNKIALGVADTYVLSSVASLIGGGVPTVVVPFVNADLASRVPFLRAVAGLRAEGVRVLYGADDGWQPHPPGTGAEQQKRFPWQRVFLVATERRLAAE